MSAHARAIGRLIAATPKRLNLGGSEALVNEQGQYDIAIGHELFVSDVPFFALIAGAVMRADSVNLAILESAYPDIVKAAREHWRAAQ